MRPYLKDFDKRMDSLAIPYKLAQYCKNNVKAYRKDIISDELFYKLINYVLLFIEDCNIRQRSCSKRIISEELDGICKELGIVVDPYELTSDIINHCCENDGNRIVFDAPEEQLPPFEIRLLEGVRALKNGRYETGYELTPQCLDYIYSTKEVAEIGRVSIEQIKLEKAIKAGNFAESRYIADNLVMAIENQRRAFHSKEKIIFTNILSLKVSDVINDINDALEMIKNQREDSIKIKKLLETANNTSEQKLRANQEIKTAFQDINYVTRQLDYILGLQMNLISVIQEFIAKYKEEMVSTDFITEHVSINIMDDIIRPIENDLAGIVNPFFLLAPLFDLKSDTDFSLNTIFREQPMLKDEEVKYTEIESPDMENAILDDSEEIYENNQQYERIFLNLLNKTAKTGTSCLSELVESDRIMTRYPNALKVVLATLLYDREIVFDDESSFRGSDDREGFYPETLHLKCNYPLSGKKLTVITDDTEEITLEDTDEIIKMKTTIRVPQMYFTISEAEEDDNE